MKLRTASLGGVFAKESFVPGVAVLWVLAGEDGVVMIDVGIAQDLQGFAEGLGASAWKAEVDERERLGAWGLDWCGHCE